MSGKIIIADGENIYAIPSDVCEKYMLSGELFEGAQEYLASLENDVEGQRCGYDREDWIKLRAGDNSNFRGCKAHAR